MLQNRLGTRTKTSQTRVFLCFRSLSTTVPGCELSENDRRNFAQIPFRSTVWATVSESIFGTRTRTSTFRPKNSVERNAKPPYCSISNRGPAGLAPFRTLTQFMQVIYYVHHSGPQNVCWASEAPKVGESGPDQRASLGRAWNNGFSSTTWRKNNTSGAPPKIRLSLSAQFLVRICHPQSISLPMIIHCPTSLEHVYRTSVLAGAFPCSKTRFLLHESQSFRADCNGRFVVNRKWSKKRLIQLDLRTR